MRGLGWHWLWEIEFFLCCDWFNVYADKTGVPVVNFPRANAILARAQALHWVRDCGGSSMDVFWNDPMPLTMTNIYILYLFGQLA